MLLLLVVVVVAVAVVELLLPGALPLASARVGGYIPYMGDYHDPLGESTCDTWLNSHAAKRTFKWCHAPNALVPMIFICDMVVSHAHEPSFSSCSHAC